jgi:hypothetical protein
MAFSRDGRDAMGRFLIRFAAVAAGCGWRRSCSRRRFRDGTSLVLAAALLGW